MPLAVEHVLAAKFKIKEGGPAEKVVILLGEWCENKVHL
jgi:hypothetical protein